MEAVVTHGFTAAILKTRWNFGTYDSEIIPESASGALSENLKLQFRSTHEINHDPTDP